VSTKSRKTIIAGNWKMHKTVSEARALVSALAFGISNELKGETLPDIVLCPTFICLPEVVSAVKGSPMQVGAQNMDYRDSGAFTGEVSAPMLKDLGLSHVVIGHSERRQYFGETDSSVNLKTKAALSHGLIPIVCVGETLEEREAGSTDDVVSRQVKAAIKDISDADVAKIVVAYEPVWAIGTGKNCESPEANRVCKLIRSCLPANQAEMVPILYGGSVKPSTIDEQMQQSDIDGALVGGASLKAEEFLPIIKGGAKRSKLMSTKA